VNKLIGTMIVATAVVFAPLAAQANPIQHRIDRQETRIYQGVKNGSIAPREYQHLQHRENRIQAAKFRAVHSGGEFTRAEKHHINHRLNRTSRSIYRAKHN
jgi:hypothetical protein